MLYKHQKQSVAFLGRQPRVLDLSDAGTGKTLVQIEAFARRRKRAGKCALVLATRTSLKCVWANDVKKFAPHLTTSIANADNRAKAFAIDADIYITNHDAAKWLVKQKPAFFERFDTLIIDECSYFKHYTSQRSRALGKIKKYFKHRSGMSGTPNSNTIVDIWYPAWLIDDGKRLGTSFYAFRSEVCTPVQAGPAAQMVQWVDRDGAEEAVFSLLSDITIRYNLDECTDIPAQHLYTIDYELPGKQLAAYKEMQITQLLWLKKGTVSAINAAAVTTKLLQIASGAVYENPDKYHVVDTGRYELVLDLVEERQHSLVFFLWKHQRDQLVKLATARNLKFCVLDGSSTDKERAEMEANYQAGFYQVMFAHPKSAAHAITLTKGTTTIWASPTYDAEWFVQGNRRQRRLGQKEKTEVIMILAPETIETRVYAALQAKNVRMTNLLGLFEEAA